ncbi:TPA: plasmid mobilization relaxosome protein MobC [Clostridium botulinum]|nr:plasmid mobilization relaxosome protein MobC [Clostridium botulinum]
MNEIEEIKICKKCGNEYPNNKNYFSKKGNKLRDICKKCDNYSRKERANKERKSLSKSRIVLTEKEEKSFSKKAAQFNMSKADFLKLVILKAEAETFIKIDSRCFDIFNSQIMGIATNINQIAHVCNATKSVYQTDIEDLRMEFKNIREWQRKLEEEFKMIDTSIKYTNEILTFDNI